MDKKLIDYTNALSIIVFAQAVELENQRLLLDRNTQILRKCRETIEALMKAAFGEVEVYNIGDQS